MRASFSLFFFFFMRRVTEINALIAEIRRAVGIRWDLARRVMRLGESVLVSSCFYYEKVSINDIVVEENNFMYS